MLVATSSRRDQRRPGALARRRLRRLWAGARGRFGSDFCSVIVKCLVPGLGRGRPHDGQPLMLPTGSRLHGSGAAGPAGRRAREVPFYISYYIVLRSDPHPRRRADDRRRSTTLPGTLRPADPHSPAMWSRPPAVSVAAERVSVRGPCSLARRCSPATTGGYLGGSSAEQHVGRHSTTAS